jgi:acetyl-CoA carboxylase carboxyl transferase beta subunit
MVIDKIKKRQINTDKTIENKVDIPVGKWVKCDKCGEIIYKEDLHKNFSICPYCNNYFRLSSRRRLNHIVDEGSFIPFELNIETSNPLNMDEYVKKIDGLREKTGLNEAVICGTSKINGEPNVICIMDGNFLMGSMGSAVGEMITYSIEKAIEQKLPLIIFSVSGGARMQEGIISLMQMAKTTRGTSKT